MDAKIKTITRVLIDQVEKNKENDIKKIMNDFVKFLAQEKMIDRWREIELAIHQSWKEIYGASAITVVSAHPLTEELNKQIEELAKGADIERRVDERLIGGSVIRIDDRRIDGSIAGNLQKLKMTLSK
ncbi:hypothetical protein A2258_00270 [Candidatus Uhrbacteria bacterium RIFOXYA2_FULL_41_8]|nr:MAG: hypothetical protein A2258_00270 [Candidatus Uhrbacteria bacterium RIFOXYA2_FULL_41_8]